jgi:3-methylcrotonyl-CoA carboxylase alpha subunit
VGTVEFLLRDEAFFFLEMNTRLQVEHPVTEMIAGQDLVEWQLRVACGEKLPLTQDELVMRGCAMEVRVCAENPARDFLPSVGEIRHLRAPRESPTVRVDTGVRRGDRIMQYYDSLIAKLVVWGADRAATLRTLQSALDEFELVGVATNLDLLRGLAKHSLFASGEYDTEFIERNADALTTPAALAESDETVILAAGAAAWLAEVRQRERERARDSGDRWSPWGIADGWRANASFYHDICFDVEGRKLSGRVHLLVDGAFRLESPSISVVVATQSGDRLSLRVDGVKRELGVVARADGLVVILAGRNYFLKFDEGLTASPREAVWDRRLTAPLPAKVTRILAGAGDRVRKGAPLVILEAMKMEITLTAPRDGVIESVRCAEGEMTAEGVELIALAEDEPA